jgi:hypothetical protein
MVLKLACSGLEQKIGCGTEPLYARQASTDGPLTSPDGQKVLTIAAFQDRKDPDGYISYRVRAGAKTLTARLSGFRTEALWSPDSSAFAANQTVGGGGIGERAFVFYLEKNKLRRVDIFRRVEEMFGSPVKCEVPVPPNTGVIQWLGPKRVLVAAEVVPVSICQCSGTFQTYELSLPDLKLLRVYPQAKTKELLIDELGCELQRADDRCARSWQKK